MQPNNDRLPLVKEEGGREEWIEIQEVDPIFSTTFEMMIKEAFRADKHFILAKVLTRSQTQTIESRSHLFNTYGILRLLFKKKGDEIVGRYHH